MRVLPAFKSRSMASVMALILLLAMLASCSSEKSPTSNTTGNSVEETITTPGIPIGPATGEVGESLAFSMAEAVSSESHLVYYTFYWGDGSSPVFSNQPTLAHTFAAVGTFDIRVAAYCIEHPSVWSESSPIAQVVIGEPIESVSTPVLDPAGDVEMILVGNYVFSAAATSSFDHELSYQFDFGDGAVGDWGSSSVSNTFPSSGVYEVKARARCTEHSHVESQWSEITTVTVPEYLSQPTVSGPATGTVGNPVTFTTGGSESSEDHAVEYQLYISTVSYSLGTAQGWTTADNLVYTFPSARTWYARVGARCIEHQVECSVNSYPHTIVISQ